MEILKNEERVYLYVEKGDCEKQSLILIRTTHAIVCTAIESFLSGLELKPYTTSNERRLRIKIVSSDTTVKSRSISCFTSFTPISFMTEFIDHMNL